jgi:transcription elongation factor Elf1
VIKQELEFLNSKGLPLPTMCPTCRQERRLSLRDKRQLIKAKCDKCGKEMITTPKANPKVKVYCDSCFKEYLNTTDPIIK